MIQSVICDEAGRGMASNFQWYTIREDIRQRSQAKRAFRAVMDILAARTAFVEIDTVTDYARTLTTDELGAERLLRSRAERHWLRRSDLRVHIDASDSLAWGAVQVYGPWSINVDLFDTTAAQKIANFHDCCREMIFLLTAEEAASLSNTLGAGFTVELLREYLDRQG